MTPNAPTIDEIRAMLLRKLEDLGIPGKLRTHLEDLPIQELIRIEAIAVLAAMNAQMRSKGIEPAP